MNPPTSRPPAVPESGNAKYGLVVLGLLLAMGGIFAWRSMSSKADGPAPPPPTPSAASAPAPTNPKLEDIPLPPPPDEKPEGGPTGPRIVYVSASAGCEGRCVGKPTADLQGALTVRGSQARRCYNQALAQDSTLKGHVQLTVRIGPSGNVCSANVAGNDMGSAAVANCAANIFRTSGGFPAPHGGCIDVTVPLSFVPQGQ
jgi:hypothetical protein